MNHKIRRIAPPTNIYPWKVDFRMCCSGVAIDISFYQGKKNNLFQVNRTSFLIPHAQIKSWAEQEK